MKQLRVVIADDEPLARENMRDMLSAHPEVAVVGEADTVSETREILIKMRPDAVFLDIQMPGGTGFDALAGLEAPVNVVFVTAYDTFAIRAFQVNAIDYLLKPVDRKLLAGAIQRLMANAASSSAQELSNPAKHPAFAIDDDVLVHQQSVYAMIPLKTLSAIRAYRNYTEVIDMQARTHLFRRSIKDWANRLPNPPFLQLDRSLIINTDALSGWRSSGRNLDLAFQHGPKTLQLGRTASDRFKKFVECNRVATGQLEPHKHLRTE